MRSLYVVILAVAVIAACGSPKPVEGDDSVYGYRSADALVLMDGDKQLAKVSAGFRNNTQQLRFTSDHLYLFSSTDDHKLAVINTREYSTRMIDCGGCGTVQPYGTNSVAWVTEDGQLFSESLSSPQSAPEVLHSVALPPSQDAASTRLLATTHDQFVIARTTRQRQGPEALFLYSSQSGQVKELGSTAANTPIKSAAVDGSGQLFAYAAYDHLNPACGAGVVGLVDLNSGSATVTQPQEAGQAIRTNVARLWWSSDNTLNAIFGKWDCSSSALKQIKPPSWWQYTDKQWTEIEPGPISQIVSLQKGERIAIVPNKSINDFKGSLYLGSKHIDNDVYAVAARQPEAPNSL
ncbi:Uncharacterised protein [Mycobacteroides abscessus subsp. abscessus]|uniref:hypothetical protein n=1 Tax=Mycobacteroides abscessus TaxID=36809 RepID=UPI0009C9C6C2|nr:hypothetical protein [Mycobacteroides abscessus]SKE08578.1 Uncharacterised protein [Mycobacteroides abscessus subsp. abscessus]